MLFLREIKQYFNCPLCDRVLVQKSEYLYVVLWLVLKFRPGPATVPVCSHQSDISYCSSLQPHLTLTEAQPHFLLLLPSLISFSAVLKRSFLLDVFLFRVSLSNPSLLSQDQGTESSAHEYKSCCVQGCDGAEARGQQERITGLSAPSSFLQFPVIVNLHEKGKQTRW